LGSGPSLGSTARSDQEVELRLEPAEDLVVAEGADGLGAALEVDVGRGAPETRSASSVSPGPLTRQPITAMVMAWSRA